MNSIKARIKWQPGYTEIKVLLRHPMANGRAYTQHGGIIAPEYITRLLLDRNGNTEIVAHLSASISSNPYFDFVLQKAARGDKISISWLDNLGNSDNRDFIIG